MTKYHIKCPACSRIMIIQTENPTKARKQCVFCGKSFQIRSAIVKE